MRSTRTLPAALVVTLALLAPGLALAGPAPEHQPDVRVEQQVRYQRPSAKSRTPRARTSALDQRLKQAKAEQEAENEAVEATRANDFHRLHQQAREMALIEKQAELLIRLLKVSTDDDIEMADMLFRLADLYLEQKAYYELQAGSLYEPIHEAEREAASE